MLLKRESSCSRNFRFHLNGKIEMSKTKVILSLALATLLGTIVASQSKAQVVVLGPSVGARIAPPIVAPLPLVGPRVVYRAPYIAPGPSYRTYAPVVPAVRYAPTSVFRPAVVGPGIGGFPNVYRPGQPIRNALRFAIP